MKPNLKVRPVRGTLQVALHYETFLGSETTSRVDLMKLYVIHLASETATCCVSRETLSLAQRPSALSSNPGSASEGCNGQMRVPKE